MTEDLELTVMYVSGEPTEIEYSHPTAGLVRFTVAGEHNEVAVIDDKWDELHWRDLKEKYDPWITTDDVIQEVEKLPFIKEVET